MVPSGLMALSPWSRFRRVDSPIAVITPIVCACVGSWSSAAAFMICATFSSCPSKNRKLAAGEGDLKRVPTLYAS